MGMNYTDEDNSRALYRLLMAGDYSAFNSVSEELQDRPGVYCIFNSESEMMYIGCSNSVKNRMATHRRHLEGGRHICKQMSADYLKNKSAFRFFCLRYIDYGKYSTQEMHRAMLLSSETMHLKRVPHFKLYNNFIPVALSEKILLSEAIQSDVKIPISEICKRLDMSPDSIRSNGFTIQDELELEDAISFVRKRTIANGRWPQDKADLAISYLTELDGFKKESPETTEYLLESGNRYDYFDDRVVAIKKRKQISVDQVRQFLFDALCIGIVIGHAGLIWYDCSEMWAMPGIIGGGIAFLIVLATVLLSTDATRVRTSSTAIWTVFILDCAAWFVHYPTFQRYATIGNLETGAICGFLCLFSFMALYIFRDSKLD